MTLVRITNRFSDGELHPAETHRAEFETPDVENVEGDFVTLTNFTEQVLNRRPGVRENQRRRARSFDAHLVFFRAGLAAVLSLNDEGGELVAVDFGKDDIDVREAAVRDEHLLAVEH